MSTEVMNLILVALTLIVLAGQMKYLAGQMRTLKISYLADHERRKKQSTIEYVNNFRDVYRHLEERIFKDHGKETIPFNTMTEADKVSIRHALSLVEHLAIGIDAGIYDFELLNRMSGSFYMNMYCKFKPYIESVRENGGNQNFYSEFETLHKNICQRRKLGSAGGALQHS